MPPIFLFLALSSLSLGADLASVSSIPASTLDSLGDTAGGFGSGACYDRKAGILYLTTDRGPGDGVIDFSPRLYAVPIPTSDAQPSVGPRSLTSGASAKEVVGAVDAEDKNQGTPEPSRSEAQPLRAGAGVNLKLAEPGTARLYKDNDGKPFTGLMPDSPDPEPRMKDGRRCLDPEGLALMKDGNLFVCEEYYPSILQFKPDGTLLSRFVPPDNYLPRNASGEVDFRQLENRAEGREDNRGFEGVALSPDGKTVYALLQSGLVQDGGKEAGATRLLAFDALTGAPNAEYAIRLPDPAALEKKGKKLKSKNISLTELSYLSDGRLIAIERDNRGQDGSADPKPVVLKQVITLDLSHATDLLALPDKPYSLRLSDPKFKKLDARQDIQYVKTGTLFDFDSLDLPSQGLAWDQLPEKWEGLALLSDDRLLVLCDNDFLTPELTLGGKKVPFPKCQNTVPTRLLTIQLP